ncbi:nucleosome assembly family protein [Tieghemostelium lacteum]|uniref:Nucleosome assembly family protein n=1 Tax=Tieghemostelium lacteum TaxID=361077 RepID=A0A152A8Y1_TIELA|nr:nucleosome assembly family protein [Tieghemostelium lacteum]|eukprot:KYR02591.1 nucleosome assembly family protein [Tieghemostelium lacteum]
MNQSNSKNNKQKVQQSKQTKSQQIKPQQTKPQQNTKEQTTKKIKLESQVTNSNNTIKKDNQEKPKRQQNNEKVTEAQLQKDKNEIVNDGDNELTEITDIQVSIEDIMKKEMKAKVELDVQFYNSLKPLVQEREKLFSNIPNFWFTVFKNHHIISNLLSGKDEDLLKNLNNFNIEMNNQGNVKFLFNFKPNNIIKNKQIWKEYIFSDDDIEATVSKLEWKNGMDITIRKDGSEPSFFSWFSSEDTELEIFTILKNELYLFPLDYFQNE